MQPALAAKNPSGSSPQGAALLRLQEVMRLTSMSRSWIYEAVRDGRFPRPVRLPGSVTTAWRSRDVVSWIDSLEEDGCRP